jgi:hypothetical protein
VRHDRRVTGHMTTDIVDPDGRCRGVQQCTHAMWTYDQSPMVDVRLSHEASIPAHLVYWPRGEWRGRARPIADTGVQANGAGW